MMPNIPAPMIITRESRRKNRGLILRKVIIPIPTPTSNAGIREAANKTICASIKPDTERAKSEKEH